MLIFESKSVSDVGIYEIPFLASLVDYPALSSYRQYIPVEITEVEPIKDNSISVAWFLLPVAIIVFFIGGAVLGAFYQKRKEKTLQAVHEEVKKDTPTPGEGPAGVEGPE